MIANVVIFCVIFSRTYNTVLGVTDLVYDKLFIIFRGNFF